MSTPRSRISGTMELVIDIAVAGTTHSRKDGQRTYKPLKIWGVYLPPEGSHQTTAQEERQAIVQGLGPLIIQDEEKYTQMVVGDTNARVGDMDDAKIVEDGREEIWNSMERAKNQDQLSNITGKIITQIARSSTNMFIMNGRTLPNEFTFKQVDEKSSFGPRRSNCDTALADRSIIEQSEGSWYENEMSDHKQARITIRTETKIDIEEGGTFRAAYQKYKQEWKLDQKKVLEFEHRLRADKKEGQCYPDNEDIKSASRMMKEAKTKKEAQTAVDAWM